MRRRELEAQIAEILTAPGLTAEQRVGLASSILMDLTGRYLPNPKYGELEPLIIRKDAP